MQQISVVGFELIVSIFHRHSMIIWLLCRQQKALNTEKTTMNGTKFNKQRKINQKSNR